MNIIQASGLNVKQFLSSPQHKFIPGGRARTFAVKFYFR